jgi:hypothetical protein
VISALIVWVLSIATILFYFYAPNFRILATVLLTGAVLVDLEMHFGTYTNTYEPTNEYDLTVVDAASSLYKTLLTKEAVLIITGVIAGCSLIGVVMMKFFRVRAARRALAAAVNKAKTRLTSAHTEISKQKKKIKQLQCLSGEFLKNLDAVSSLRPTIASNANEHIHTARDLIWSYCGSSTVIAIHQSMFYRSACLVCPALFTMPSTLNQMQWPISPSGDTKPSRTDENTGKWTSGTTVNDDRNSLTQPSLPAMSSVRSSHGGTAGDGIATELYDQNFIKNLQHLVKLLVKKEKQEEDILLFQLSNLNLAYTAGKPGERSILNPDLLVALQPAALGPDDKKVSAFATSSALQLIAQCSQQYRPTLQHILSHPVTVELFKDHLHQNASVENGLFLVQLQKWKLLKNDQLRQVIARAMFDEFIAEGSQHQINIDSVQRQQISTAIVQSKGKKKALPNELFARAEREVMMLIGTNNWKSFTSAPAYTVCTAILVRNAAVMAALQMDTNMNLREDLKAIADEGDILDAQILSGDEDAQESNMDLASHVTVSGSVEQDETVPIPFSVHDTNAAEQSV